MIQPISTLRDHPNVFKLPGNKKKEKPVSPLNLEDDDDPQEQVNEAYQGVQQALEASRTKNLNDFLLDDPEKPEIDDQKVKQNKKAARVGLILQALDSLGSLATSGGEGADPGVTPARYDQIGLTALNNLNNLDEQQQVDLRNYNKDKRYTDRLNQELRMNLQNQQDDIGIKSAQLGLEQAQFNMQQELDEEERERLAQDDQAQRWYDAGLRMASQGEVEVANEFFKNAGLNDSTIDSLIEKSKKTKRENGIPTELKVLDVKRPDIALYNRYKQYEGQASDEDYPVDPGTNKILFEEGPKRGTPSWHLKKIEDDLGSKFYLIDDYYEDNQSDGPSREYLELSEQMQRSPEIQEKQLQAYKTYQKTLMDGFVNAQNDDQKKQSKELWMANNEQILRSMGVDDEEIPSVNEEMFSLMMDEMSGSEEPPETNYADQTEEEDTEPDQGEESETENNVTQAGMGSSSPQKDRELRGVAETLFGPVGGAIAEHIPKLKGLNTDQIYGIAKGIYDQFKKAGVQIRSRQEDRLQDMYGDKWKSLIDQMKSENPDVSDDYLRYLLIEAPNSELIPKDNG